MLFFHLKWNLIISAMFTNCCSASSIWVYYTYKDNRKYIQCTCYCLCNSRSGRAELAFDAILAYMMKAPDIDSNILCSMQNIPMMQPRYCLHHSIKLFRSTATSGHVCARFYSSIDLRQYVCMPVPLWHCVAFAYWMRYLLHSSHLYSRPLIAYS